MVLTNQDGTANNHTEEIQLPYTITMHMQDEHRLFSAISYFLCLYLEGENMRRRH